MDKGIRRGHSVYTMSGGINKSYCLVLGGGGARGAYEIGVWKALRELEIPINAVAGTSAGALNAAFVAQDDFETAEKLFRNITINQIANIPREFLTAGKIDRDLGKLRRLSGYLLEHRGLDTSPLKKLIESHLKEDVIRNSGMDFGLVTYNLSSFTPMHCFLEDIPAGRLSEFLFASASHPLFGPAKIDKAHLTDGGVTDNIPYNMMKQRGYRRIIAVDLSGMGRVRKFRTENSETVYIKNSIKLAGVMDFTPEDSCRAMDLGYLDTLRSFGEIEGVRYFIHPQYDTLKAFSQKLSSPETDTLIAETAGKLQSSRENTLLNDRPLGSLLPPELSMQPFSHNTLNGERSSLPEHTTGETLLRRRTAVSGPQRI